MKNYPRRGVPLLTISRRKEFLNAALDSNPKPQKAACWVDGVKQKQRSEIFLDPIFGLLPVGLCRKDLTHTVG